MSHVPHLRVLVIEDDPDTRENLCDILSLDGHEYDVAACAKDALAPRNWPAYHVILLDWRLPDASAETVLPRLRELAPEAAVIVSTGVGGVDQAVTALRHGAVDYIAKPVDADLLRASLKRVAEQQRLKEDKVRSEAAFRTLVEAAGSMIMILAPTGEIQYINPFGEQLTGYRAEELLHQSCIAALVADEFHAAAAECLEHVLTGNTERGYELPVVDRRGRLHWLLWNVQHLHEFAGEPAILAIGQDVTDRKTAEQKLLQSERLAAIGQAMAGLAHESRNALQRGQADLELLELLVEGNSEATALIRRLQRVQQELHRLYEEVRQYAAPIKLMLEPQSLEAVAQEAWELLAPSRGSRCAELLVVNGDGSNCCADRFQMLQVFRNLFENSLSASPDPARIVVTFERRPLGGSNWLCVTISDNGPGIPPHATDSVLEPFFTTKTRGTGLGLSIVRRIVEAHGGRMMLGTPQVGAELNIELPA
ncbi:MAG: PAS domain S-box protein [Planctomycetaceae bacterium]|nr:PAS domain S-box protein [Planctomycetaceae bacterium]